MECNFPWINFDDINSIWQYIEITEKFRAEMYNTNTWESCRRSYQLKYDKGVDRTFWIPQFGSFLIQGSAAIRVKCRIPYEDIFWRKVCWKRVSGLETFLTSVVFLQKKFFCTFFCRSFALWTYLICHKTSQHHVIERSLDYVGGKF